MIKQIEPNRVSLCGVDFAIYPFGAMKAANLSGELGKFLGPIVAGCLPLIGSNDDDVLSMDLKDAMPLVTGAFSTLDGDTIEKLFRKLLLQQNISCSYTDPATGQPVQTWLTQDVLDQVFCQNVDDMYRLAYEVINVNFKGFFKKLLGQSGGLSQKVVTILSGSMENSTEANLPTSN